MRGTVSFVASGITSASAMASKLTDPTLAEQFLREVGLPKQIEVTPTAAPPERATVSGYEWTSRNGPPIRISPGTLCDAWVTIKERPPFHYVIPLFDDDR
jgi:hypothetical protein